MHPCGPAQVLWTLSINPLTVGRHHPPLTPYMLLQICGQSNIQLMEAAKEAGVDRFAFVSAHNMGLPGGLWRQLHEAGTAVPQVIQPTALEVQCYTWPMLQAACIAALM